MKNSYLEVTYRKGKAIAAYYYLPRKQDDVSARTERFAEGLIVDFSADGRPIGVEITSPSKFRLQPLNDVLSRIGQEPIRPEDVAPLVA